MPTKILINGLDGGRIYRTRLTFIDLPGSFTPQVSFLFESSVLCLIFGDMCSGDLFRRAFYEADLVRVTCSEPPGRLLAACRADFGSKPVWEGWCILSSKLRPEDRAFLEKAHAFETEPKKPAVGQGAAQVAALGHAQGCPSESNDSTGPPLIDTQVGLPNVWFGSQQHGVLRKTLDPTAGVWCLVMEERTFVLEPQTLTRLELAEAFEAPQVRLEWFRDPDTGRQTFDVTVNTGDRIFVASFKVLDHTGAERFWVAEEVGREIAGTKEVVRRGRGEVTVTTVNKTQKTLPGPGAKGVVSDTKASGIQPVPAPPVEVDEAILWFFWQKIQDELDRHHKRTPSASQVFVCYCRDRMTLRKMELEFKWSYRTIKARKAELEALLSRHGYNLDRFIVDRSMFRGAEKRLADYRAKRNSGGLVDDD